MASQEYKHIIRIAGNDIPGEKKTIIGISQVKGIGFNLANAILIILKIDPNSNIGYLTDSQVQTIEGAVKNPSSINMPSWFLNRRKDIETGNNLHLITSDIDFNVRNDIEREKNTNSWRGFRHTFGLKVRGQRTRTTGRKGGAVGVRKGGKILPPGVAPSEAVASEEGAPVEAGAEGAGKESTAKKVEPTAKTPGSVPAKETPAASAPTKKPSSKGESK